MHAMWTIAFDDTGRLFVMQLLCCANVAEQIEVLLGVETLDDSRNISPYLPNGFDAAFAKLLWSLFCFVVVEKKIDC